MSLGKSDNWEDLSLTLPNGTLDIRKVRRTQSDEASYHLETSSGKDSTFLIVPESELHKLYLHLAPVFAESVLEIDPVIQGVIDKEKELLRQLALGKYIVEIVCGMFDLSISEFSDTSRKGGSRSISRAVFAWLVRQFTTLSFPKMARLFGINHATFVLGNQGACIWNETNREFSVHIDNEMKSLTLSGIFNLVEERIR